MALEELLEKRVWTRLWVLKKNGLGAFAFRRTSLWRSIGDRESIPCESDIFDDILLSCDVKNTYTNACRNERGFTSKSKILEITLDFFLIRSAPVTRGSVTFIVF